MQHNTCWIISQIEYEESDFKYFGVLKNLYWDIQIWILKYYSAGLSHNHIDTDVGVFFVYEKLTTKKSLHSMSQSPTKAP